MGQILLTYTGCHGHEKIIQARELRFKTGGAGVEVELFYGVLVHPQFSKLLIAFAVVYELIS